MMTQLKKVYHLWVQCRSPMAYTYTEEHKQNIYIYASQIAIPLCIGIVMEVQLNSLWRGIEPEPYQCKLQDGSRLNLEFIVFHDLQHLNCQETKNKMRGLKDLRQSI